MVIKGTDGGLMVSAYEHHAISNAAASEASRGREVVYVRPKVGGYLMPETLSVETVMVVRHSDNHWMHHGRGQAPTTGTDKLSRCALRWNMVEYRRAGGSRLASGWAWADVCRSLC